MDDDVCLLFQPEVIWHDAILDMLRTNHKTSFSSTRTLKAHLRHHPDSDVPLYLHFFSYCVNVFFFHFDCLKLLLYLKCFLFYLVCILVSGSLF